MQGINRALAGCQEADIRDVEAIDILGGIDHLDDRIGIDMRWQRQLQLHQNAVNRRVGIQLTDQRQQLHFGRFSGSLCSKLAMPAATV